MANGKTTAPSLNLRDAPEGGILGSLPRGRTVVVLERDGDWLRISVSVDGETCLAWVNARWISIAAPPSAAAGKPVAPSDDSSYPTINE